jgi:hypothetical protein
MLSMPAMEKELDPAPRQCTILAMKLFLAKNKIPTITQPQHSSDLAP